MFCYSCSAENSDDAKYCRECGIRLPEIQSYSYSSADMVERNQRIANLIDSLLLHKEKAENKNEFPGCTEIGMCRLSYFGDYYELKLTPWKLIFESQRKHKLEYFIRDIVNIEETSLCAINTLAINLKNGAQIQIRPLNFFQQMHNWIYLKFEIEKRMRALAN